MYRWSIILVYDCNGTIDGDVSMVRRYAHHLPKYSHNVFSARQAAREDENVYPIIEHNIQDLHIGKTNISSLPKVVNVTKQQ